MTLDEAIEHTEEVAEQNEEDAIIYSNCKKYKKNLYEIGLAKNAEKECCKCAEEHRQLAEWLWQLKQIQDIVQEYHDNYIEWGTGQSSVAFHKIVKIIEGGEE